MKTTEYPFFIKSTVVLLGLILFSYTIIYLKDILSPVAFATMFAILLNPLVNRFQKKKVPKVLSIFLAMIIAILVIAGILYFLSSQIARFGESVPLFIEKFGQITKDVQQWLFKSFGISLEKQVQVLKDAGNSSKALVGQTVGTAVGILGFVFLLPVYVFLFLFYKPLILKFLYEVFAKENNQKVEEVLNETKTAIQSYMVGLLIEASIIAVLNSTALLILGVRYAIVIGVIAAILNMIPYVGGLIALLIPLLVATATEDGYSTQIGILIAYGIIQFVDNNFLVPKIVSSKVKINALASILIVLLGGTFWGVAGMFLSIPMVAILKIIFDRIDELKPWGKLLGDEVPVNYKAQVQTSDNSTKGDSLAEEMIKRNENK